MEVDSATVEERTTGRCPRCGAPHDPYQEYCLECGLRLPFAEYYRRRTTWSRESPLWLAGALIALLLVALAGAAAAIWAAGEERTTKVVTRTAAGTPTVVTGPTTATLPTLPETETILPTTTQVTIPTLTAPPPPPPPPAAGATLTTWPAGRAGYTIVLKSVPHAQGRNAAEDEARRALNQGLTQVGVLDSSNFTSLRPGFYVTFKGIYDATGAAAADLGTVRTSGFPLAYVREIRA